MWHELAHADRRDTAGHNSPAVERVVERHAAGNAMPWTSLWWAWQRADNTHEMAGLLKIPEDWMHFRLAGLHPARKAQLRACATPDGC